MKAAGGGKAGEVTTGFDGQGYEVTVTKSDGSKTEIHLDSSFNAVQGGHGGGNCPGGRMGPPGGSSSGSSSGSSGSADSSGSGSAT